MVAINFKRKEKKYVLSPAQYEAMRQVLAGHMRVDGFGATPVVSLYFDTPERLLIGRSIENPLYKEKIRLRSYGEFSEDKKVFLELKKKFKGIVYKRRVVMSLSAAQAFIAGKPYEQCIRQFPCGDDDIQREALNANAVQIASEIAAAIKRYPGLQPSMYTRCIRQAYVPCAHSAEHMSDLRITFDTQLTYEDVEWGARGSLLEPGGALMEIKTSGACPLWLVQALSENRIYPQSFSKYGNAYKQVASQRIAYGSLRAYA